MPIKLQDLLEGMSLSQSPSLRQMHKLECPLCQGSITGSDVDPDDKVQVKLFGANQWIICPHCKNPNGDPKDVEWKVKVTTYLYNTDRKVFNELDPEWKKQWIKIIYLTDKTLFRKLAKKRD
jgi:hypothetical protein